LAPALIADRIRKREFGLAQKLALQSMERFSIFQIDHNNTGYS
jgi:hypothetical protein